MRRHLIMIMAFALLLAVATPVMVFAVTEDYRTNSEDIVAEVIPVIMEDTKTSTPNILEKEPTTLVLEGYTSTRMADTYLATDEEGSRLFIGLTDVEVLAKFLQHEGGELFERVLVAQIVVDLLHDDSCPHDSLKALLGDERYFYIHETFWRKMGLIEDENLVIAQMVWEMSKTTDDQTSYDGYYYRFVVEDYPPIPFLEDAEVITTDNYVFYKKN